MVKTIKISGLFHVHTEEVDFKPNEKCNIALRGLSDLSRKLGSLYLQKEF
jgi:hypothetical protein